MNGRPTREVGGPDLWARELATWNSSWRMGRVARGAGQLLPECAPIKLQPAGWREIRSDGDRVRRDLGPAAGGQYWRADEGRAVGQRRWAAADSSLILRGAPLLSFAPALDGELGRRRRGSRGALAITHCARNQFVRWRRRRHRRRHRHRRACRSRTKSPRRRSKKRAPTNGPADGGRKWASCARIGAPPLPRRPTCATFGALADGGIFRRPSETHFLWGEPRAR